MVDSVCILICQRPFGNLMDIKDLRPPIGKIVFQFDPSVFLRLDLPAAIIRLTILSNTKLVNALEVRLGK